MNSTIILSCEHCGNTTAFTIFREGSALTTIPSQGTEKTTRVTWRVVVCSTCSLPILEREMYVMSGPLEFKPPHGPAPDPPSSVPQTLLASLPPLIARMYQETVRVKDRSPRACAVMAGLTLEAACQHEHAKGCSLSEQLNIFVAAERIPKMLAEMAHHIPQLRNIGAHLTKEEILPEDVPVILDFVEEILDYLYVAPAKHGTGQEYLTAGDLF